MDLLSLGVLPAACVPNEVILKPHILISTQVRVAWKVL